MKIKLIATRLILPPWLDVETFCRYLKTRNGELFPGDRHRMMHVHMADDVTHGIIIAMRSRTKYLQYGEAEDGNPDLRVAKLKNLAEFCCFFMRHDSGGGLITQYQGSMTGAYRVGRLLKKRYRQYQRDIKAKDKELARKAKQEGKRMAVPKRSGHAQFEKVFTKETWEKYLAKVERIYEYRTTDARVFDETKKHWLPEEIVSETHVIRFGESLERKSLLEKLKNAYYARKPQRASVRVQDKHGEDATCRIGPNVESFPSLDYDAHVGELSLKTFWKSGLMNTLLDHKDDMVIRTIVKP